MLKLFCKKPKNLQPFVDEGYESWIRKENDKDARRFRVLGLAFEELGTKEIAGKSHNPDILEYHKATGLKAGSDEVAWCSSFVNWVLDTLNLERTHSAAARSWQKAFPDKEGTPELGDIVVFSRGNNPNKGHVGFFLSESEGQIYVLGGNQGNQVSVKPYPQSRFVHCVDITKLKRVVL